MLIFIHPYKSVKIYCLQLGRKPDKPSSIPITHRVSTYPSTRPLTAHRPTSNPRATLMQTTARHRRPASNLQPTPTATPPRQGSIIQGTQLGPRTAIRAHHLMALLQPTQRRLRRCSRESLIHRKDESTNAGDYTAVILLVKNVCLQSINLMCL